MTSRALAALGVAQCVNWGVLYYSFSVFLLPVQRDLGAPQWVVAGAFSGALLTSAVVAPYVGRASDRGLGLLVMRHGGFAAAALLLVWAAAPGLMTLYVVWAALGACMAATLYEPAFAVVGRAFHDPRQRLRALSTITVFGGLASTVFLPIAAALTNRWGWRTAVVALAGTTALATLVASSLLQRDAPAQVTGNSRDVRDAPPPGTPSVAAIRTVFSLSSLASAAFSATAVAAFIERGLTPQLGAMLGGLMGVMQLPGRLVVMSGGLSGSPSRLLILCLAMQAAGLAMLTAASIGFIVAGVATFSLGSGLLTLIRPYLIQHTFGIAQAGALNGTVARSQQFARAAGPVTASALASLMGYRAAFGLLAILVAALAVDWLMRGRTSAPIGIREAT